jgi:hypothetical protein
MFKVTSQQMNRELLLERAPILFSEEVPLYESEMDDNGATTCTVRVRCCTPVCNKRKNWLVVRNLSRHSAVQTSSLSQSDAH